MKRLVPVTLACAGLLTGCGSIDRPATPTASAASFQEHAAVVARTWLDSGISKAWTTGFVPLGELTAEPAWSPNGDLKASYGNGWIRSTPPLSDKAGQANRTGQANSAGQGDIRFADGTSLPVPLVGAQTAYGRFPKRSGPCPMAGQPPTCQWLTITATRLSTVKIRTSRGLAIVPAWLYTVAGLTGPLVSVAVAPSATTSIPQVKPSDDRPPDGVVSAMGLISGSGNVLVFNIGIGACDKDPLGLVRETPELVVVGGSVTRPDAGTPCTANLEIRRVEVRLQQPVGTRPIVDARSGKPMLNPPAALAP